MLQFVMKLIMLKTVKVGLAIALVPLSRFLPTRVDPALHIS